MIRRLAVAAALAVLVSASTDAGWAAEDDGFVDVTNDQERATVSGHVRTADGTEASVATVALAPPEDVGVEYGWLPWPEDAERPAGYGEGELFCHVLRVVVYPGARDATPLAPPHVGSPRCPPGTPGDTDVRGAVERVVRSWPMPPPGPHIAPGEAITGLPAFLEPGGRRIFPVHTQLLGGNLSITARTVAYDVAWGDGHAQRYAGVGGPYPNGDIVYTYADVGEYTVLVTQWWAAEWSFAGGVLGSHGGTVTGLWSQSSIDDFPVGQIQAVRIR